MKHDGTRPRNVLFALEESEFWSGDLGLTLITLSLLMLIFVVTPLREAGLAGRFILDLAIAGLMISATLAIHLKSSIKILAISFVALTACILAAGRLHPTLFLHQVGSLLVTATLLIYVRIVVAVMFRGSPITWSRVQGGVSIYLLLGMAWASAYQALEEFRPGSFHFVTVPGSFDQLIAKLTYFSFTTLTTVGGEVSPLSPMARSLTIAEAMVGQLFPAMFIGALVALAMESRSKS